MYVLLVFLFLQLTSKCSDGCLQPARHRQCCVGTPVHSGGLASARGSTHVLGRLQSAACRTAARTSKSAGCSDKIASAPPVVSGAYWAGSAVGTALEQNTASW